MSLTGTHHAFLAVHEDALNTIIGAFKAARPWYFSYGSSMLGGGSPPAATTYIAPIDIPGTGVSFEYRFDIKNIIIDCFPEEADSELPPELAPLKKDELSLRADVRLITLCPEYIVSGSSTATNKQQDYAKDYKEIRCCLKLFAVLSPVGVLQGDGSTKLSMTLRGIEIVDIAPDCLESILECFLETVLQQAVLPKLTYTIDKISTDFFKFGLTEGPHVDDNKIFAFGDVL